MDSFELTPPPHLSDEDWERMIDFHLRDEGPNPFEELALRLEHDEAWTTALIARRMAVALDRRDRLDAQHQAMDEHWRFARAAVVEEIALLDGVMKDKALALREATGGKIKGVTLLGVGDYSTRPGQEGWTITPTAAMRDAFMADPDGWSWAFLKTEIAVEVPALRRHLDALLDAARASAPDEAAVLAAADAIAAALGVTYRPKRMTVKGPLD